MTRAGLTHRETGWGSFWHDCRRLNVHVMAVLIVALSFKVYRVYFLHDPDPWLLHPRYFARWTAPPRPLPPLRPAPYIHRPPNRVEAGQDLIQRGGGHAGFHKRTFTTTIMVMLAELICM
jgi:hypothetical protein